MRYLFSTFAAVAAAGVLVLAPAVSEAKTCVNKGGRGTGSTVEDARFQAWEAVLQATSWPMWASWMASSAKVVGNPAKPLPLPGLIVSVRLGSALPKASRPFPVIKMDMAPSAVALEGTAATLLALATKGPG